MDAYVVVAAVVVTGILLVSAAGIARRLTAREPPRVAKQTTHESGVDPVGRNWAQTPDALSDIGVPLCHFRRGRGVSLSWALVLQTAMGPATLVEITIFVAVVLVSLVHGARQGLLRWLGVVDRRAYLAG
ncbi:MAG: NADH-quinone oxidoreductase subunit A [Tetrasphaera sp.]|nr:NADH-quinone oxidoreductase subunit A [Tetrasphaera sp.]